MLINSRRGRKKGERGVTVHILKQCHPEERSRTLTLKGYSVDDVYKKVLFYFRSTQRHSDVAIEVESFVDRRTIPAGGKK